MTQTSSAPAASHPRGHRRVARATLVGGFAGALLTTLMVGPIAAAVVLLRCCDDSRGPDPMAWVVIGMVVLLLAAAGAAVGAGIARLIGGVVARMR